MAKHLNTNRAIPVLITPENKCGYCTNSKCCTYITQKINGPRSKYDFEHLLWQVSHDGVEAYKDSDGWYLLSQGRCEHLLADGRCDIYEKRPDICRDHSNDFCEFDEPAEKHYSLHFTNYVALRRYCKRRFARWDK